MNNVGATLRVSLIPIFIIIAIIAGAGFFLMRGEIELPKLGKDITEVRRIDGYPTTVYTNQIIEKQRLVIKNQDELNAFLNLIDPQGTEISFTEPVNFEKEYLIGVATETLKTNGYTLRVKRIEEDKEKQELKVVLIETRPDDTCEVDVQSNVSMDIIAMSKTDWEINFERLTETEMCEDEAENGDEATTTDEENSGSETEI